MLLQLIYASSLLQCHMDACYEQKHDIYCPLVFCMYNKDLNFCSGHYSMECDVTTHILTLNHLDSELQQVKADALSLAKKLEALEDTKR